MLKVYPKILKNYLKFDSSKIDIGLKPNKGMDKFYTHRSKNVPQLEKKYPYLCNSVCEYL